VCVLEDYYVFGCYDYYFVFVIYFFIILLLLLGCVRLCVMMKKICDKISFFVGFVKFFKIDGQNIIISSIKIWKNTFFGLYFLI